MTVKKAIQAIDMLLENKKKVRAGILDPTQSWNEEKDMVRMRILSNEKKSIISADKLPILLPPG